MTQAEIRNNFLKGGKLAIDRLLDKKRRISSYVVVSENGKVVKLDAVTLQSTPVKP